MKTKSVPMSLVASHPFNSLAVDDYLAEPEHVKKLILEGTPSSKARIDWMIDQGIITPDEIRTYVQEMVDAEQEIANRKIVRICDALVYLKLIQDEGEKDEH